MYLFSINASRKWEREKERDVRHGSKRAGARSIARSLARERVNVDVNDESITQSRLGIILLLSSVWSRAREEWPSGNVTPPGLDQS